MGKLDIILKALNKVIDLLSTAGKNKKAASKLVPRPKFIILNESSLADGSIGAVAPIYNKLSDLRIMDIISGKEKLDEGITMEWDPAFSSPEFDNYVSDGKLLLHLDDVETARLDALDYFTSLLRRQVDAEHVTETRSLGMTYHPNEYSEFALTRPLYVYNTDLGRNFLGRTYQALYTDLDNNLITRVLQPLYVMKLNPINKSYYPQVAYHEHLHIGNLGDSEGIRPNETIRVARTRMSDNKEYLTWKLNLLMLSPEEIADLNYVPLEALYRANNGNRSFADLLYDISETSVSLMEAGRLAGILPGAQYPGDEKFNLIYNSLVSRDEFCVDPLKYVKHTTPLEKQNVWKALNGTFFMLPAALLLGTGYYMWNKNNSY